MLAGVLLVVPCAALHSVAVKPTEVLAESVPEPALLLNYTAPGIPGNTGAVGAGQWVDMYTKAEAADESIIFEVVAQSSSPTSVSIHVYDGRVASVNSVGQPILADPVHPSGPPKTASLDDDAVSHIATSDGTRTFYAYVGQCYIMQGAFYYLSIYGQGGSAVKYSASAIRVNSRLAIDGVPTTGRVCDGKYLHYFWDIDHVPATGGLQLRVRKTSGELDAFYVRQERCVAAPDSAFAQGNLFGHGLSSGVVQLPSEDQQLLPGRYYVSVRGSIDMCGTFEISIKRQSMQAWWASSPDQSKNRIASSIH